jgi:UDP-N-acetylmuramoyl-L-alanyl-D-glutamate--2,6-diaminopimelate ligase
VVLQAGPVPPVATPHRRTAPGVGSVWSVSSVPLTTARPERVVAVRLADVAATVGLAGPVAGRSDVAVTGITVDSRLVRPGDLYVALPGRRYHGARFARDAVARGAAAVLTDSDGEAAAAGSGAAVLVVDDPRVAMAPIAGRIYGDPSGALTMLGITGTNGKTTTSYLLAAALRAAGHRAGVIGTIGFLLDGKPMTVPRTTVTTPESPELQALLAMMVEGGADCCVMEVSSHAMVLHRADAVAFDVAAFTNFGRDHLDFHGDEESYFAAKASLFTPEHTRQAVVNIDDPYGLRLADTVAAAGQVACYRLSLGGNADYSATVVGRSSHGHARVRLRCPRQVVEFDLGLPGNFNVRNAATALAMLDLVGVDIAAAARGLADAQVPGRMQLVDLGPGAPLVYVDFAHTPQAVTAALQAVEGRRRIAVLGCGGDRDRDKREPMGAAAARSADVVVVTDDNPRSEDPAEIRTQVLSGAVAAAAGTATLVLDGGDRRTAIRTALQQAAPEDVVAVLGKGHEPGQEIAGFVEPFSDIDVLRREWATLRPTDETPGPS